jgi:extradiol dioxygenase family protein
MITEIDHSVVAVNDLILAERFYGEVLGEILGGMVEDRSMLTTDEVIRAGRLRTTMADHYKDRPAARVPAAHSSVKLGQTVVAMFLHQEHIQEPPPEQLRGTPRLAFNVTPEQMEQAIQVFRRRKVAFEGPVDHPAPSKVARSLYFKDPSSNFLEFCVPR